MTGRQPPTEPRSTPAQYLQDLLDDTLDPGYREAARRRAAAGDLRSAVAGGRRGHRTWWEQPAIALGCLLAGFVLVVGYVHTHRGAPDAQRAHDRLVGRVQAAQRADSALSGQLARAQRSLTRAQANALPSSGALAARVARDSQVGGTVAVHGPGLSVSLSEPPQAAATTDAIGRGGSTPIAATNILTDRDIRSVVNELWHDGAEAIAVNGVRLTPTSAIRFAGEAVLVDFSPVTSPYTIDAVGDPDLLATRFASSAVASRYQTLVSADGISFSFHDEGDLKLPAGTQVTTRYASPGVSGR